RCSALRVLYLQRDVAEKVKAMLFGAMDALRIGDPLDLETDIGPVIDVEALDDIAAYVAKARDAGRVLHQVAAPKTGLFAPPTAIAVSGIEDAEREVFGPVLHIATFEADEIDAVVDAVNARGYGLTFGLHTRIDRRVQDVIDRAEIGNVYVNRNQIGAIVGSQPFGGEGLSGTGPKAGGPHYLARFRRRRVAEGAATETSRLDAGDASALLARLKPGDWGRRPDRISVLRELLKGAAAEAMNAAAALDMSARVLPGPTGEANGLRLTPLGRVLCIGEGEALFGHAVQALRAGNAVLAVGPDASRRLTPLFDPRLPFAALDGDAPAEVLATAPLDAVAISARQLVGAARAALAGREGPIIRLIDEAVAPERFAAERALCIDTTAAGGNAELLAAAG
ncbi:MAG: aldehyde dehydrogenase family protein, partial [Pseudomonadota bacterium]